MGGGYVEQLQVIVPPMQQAIAEEERDFATIEPALTFLQHVSEGQKHATLLCDIN